MHDESNIRYGLFELCSLVCLVLEGMNFNLLTKKACMLEDKYVKIYLLPFCLSKCAVYVVYNKPLIFAKTIFRIF